MFCIILALLFLIKVCFLVYVPSLSFYQKKATDTLYFGGSEALVVCNPDPSLRWELPNSIKTEKSSFTQC